MEDHTTVDATLALSGESCGPLMAGSGDVGVVLQSALRRTPRGRGGAHRAGRPDPAVQGCLPGAGRGGLAGQGGRGRGVRRRDGAAARRRRAIPAIATHDDRIVDQAIAYAREHGIGPERFEFQMLFGVRRDLQERLLRDGWGVRDLRPIGCQWYPYFMRRLAERPANVVFLVGSVWRERRAR